MNRIGRSGQALVEFVASLCLVLPALLASGTLLMTSWERMRCSHLAFEAGHAAVRGSVPPFDPRVRITSTTEGVEVTAACASVRAGVSFRKLEEIRW